ncbi:M12 family metallopeptidase [Myxococcus stipitatus]|uniref:M12 family metallopeptidase n=1 Tax=Myxococcus stipitatus TaxID=83455 RepID=UPI0031456C03
MSRHGDKGCVSPCWTRTGVVLGVLAWCASGCGSPAGDEASRARAPQELAHPGRTGEARRGSFRVAGGIQELSYEDIDGERVFQGDILLPPEVSVGGTSALSVEAHGAGAIRAISRWPGSVVPYTLDPALTNTGRVLDALRQWESVTPLRFVPRTTQADFVTFRPGSGCSSHVGRMGGQQFVTLSPTCTTGNTLHEVGHVLGLWHEQARTDRDRNVLVHWGNILPGYTQAFETFAQRGETGRNLGPYGLDSLMHYASDAFSANGESTLTRLDGSPFSANREAPTLADICAVKRLHGHGRRSDVNGDGYADLVIGTPHEDVGQGTDQGAVSVVWGSASGLVPAGLWLHRDAQGVEDVAVDADLFGAAVATGDFNGDCFADVAVGVPGDDVNGIVDAGSVHIFLGSALGLDWSTDRVFHQNTVGVPDSAEAFDAMGSSLVVGDFNGDGHDDLAVGVPGEDYGSSALDSGLVTVLFGSPTGLSGAGAQSWSQSSTRILDVSETGDRFGSALASGDFNGDGFDELAVGAPFESVEGVANVGAVHVLWGSLDGLMSEGNQLWVPGMDGLPGAVMGEVYFGSALAAGDFNGDGRSELAIGAPGQTVGLSPGAGAVTVLTGSAMGLVSTGAVAWNQDSAGISDVAEAGDGLGSTLVAEDFDGDGHLDLAIGVPRESVGTVVGAGIVHVMHGSPSGLSGVREQRWSQEGSQVDEGAEALDVFGSRLAAGDFDGNGALDLAVAAPYEDVGGVVDAGAVQVLYSAGASGLSRAREQRWVQAPVYLVDIVEASDHFGLGL